MCATTREVLACDFFATATPRFRLLGVFVVLDVGTRRLLHWNITEHPTAEWTVQQFRACVTGETAQRFVVHDHDAVHSPELDRALNSMGLDVLKTPVGAAGERVLRTTDRNRHTALRAVTALKPRRR